MHLISFLYVPALVALLAQAVPLPDIEARKFKLSKVSKPVSSNPGSNQAPAQPVSPPSSAPTVPSPAPLSIPPSSAVFPLPSSKVVSPSAKVSPPSASLSPSLESVAPTSVAPLSFFSASSVAVASSTASAARPENTTSADDSTDAFCPIYSQADLVDLEARHSALAKRAKLSKEEYWFRWEEPSLAKSGDILQLRLPHDKNFDDQAYKWISTDASKVTRGRIQSGRVGTVFVLPAGTRDAILGAAQKFEETSAAQQRADFVVKANELGDVGIQGITASADGTLPLDVFRAMVIRTVVKTTAKKAKNKATFVTITKGKRSGTATKDDQLALAVACG